MSSTDLAEYHFLSYVRRGAAAALSVPDSLSGPIAYRGSIATSLVLESAANGLRESDQANVNVQVDGPGDVVGIDPRHILRTEPRDGAANFEPNYFAAIEFDH